MHRPRPAPRGPIAGALCAIAAACLLASARAEDWPRFLGPRADGISREKGINRDWAKRPPRLLWSVTMRDDGYAGPSVAGGLVFIIDHEGSQDVVRALRLSDGSEAWRRPYADSERGVYGFARTTPAVDGDRVYALSRYGRLLCLKARTGALVWEVDTVARFRGKTPMWLVAASPLIDGPNVIVLPGGPDAAIAALDKLTGKTVWQGGGSAVPGYATPFAATLDGVRQYITMDAESAVGYRASDGSRLWSYPFKPTDGTNVAVPLLVNGGVFVSAAYGQGCALLDVRGGRAVARWTSRDLAAHVGTPVLWKGYVYGVSDPGFLVCLDPVTGKARWKQPAFEKGSVLVVDNVLLVLDGADGELVMVRPAPDQYEELGRIQPLGGQSWTYPVVANGRLLLRNRQKLACIDLRG